MSRKDDKRRFVILHPQVTKSWSLCEAAAIRSSATQSADWIWAKVVISCSDSKKFLWGKRFSIDRLIKKELLKGIDFIFIYF
jgi:hypothetical protein